MQVLKVFCQSLKEAPLILIGFGLILAAFFMVRLALQHHKEGQNDAKRGESYASEPLLCT